MMSDQSALVAREAAMGLQQGLKEALKTHEPWDKDVDLQRKNLRRRYLTLLLVYPYAKESKDVETHLWMQTSYAFISMYKQRIATLDRTLQSRHHQPQPRQGGGHGPVEHRKLTDRFSKFLAEEDKFWTQLILRFHRTFGLHEARSALVALDIIADTDDYVGANPSDGIEIKEGSRAVENGRNHFQFPSEDATVFVTPHTPADREGRLAIISKALVCLGDIARYKELYNESGGRPKAGHEDGPQARKPARGKKGDKSFSDVTRARNYDKARLCYEQARLLLPYEGNPSHQLAILASYQKDTFASLFHYYRALCVRQPYDTASENLANVLTKALEQWKARTKREREKSGSREANKAALAPRLRIEAFKENTVVLHALWRLGIEKMDHTSPHQARTVSEDFKSLVSELHLPTDRISKVIVLSQGALWKHCMIRDPVVNKKSDGGLQLPVTAVAALESRIFVHLLALHQALLEVGIDELRDAPPEENHLAQRITATFRRTLPALRIAGKWLRANFRYVIQNQESETNENARGSGTNKRERQKMSKSGDVIAEFWHTYSMFSTALLRTFPLERLPSLTSPLEEDVEMRGFLPLGKMMGEDINVADGQIDQIDPVGKKAQCQAHPNEEQLMRIADLLNDAMALAELENSPLVQCHKAFILRDTIEAHDHDRQHSKSVNVGAHHFSPYQNEEGEEDTMTDTSTTDDPVGDAFRQVLDGSDRDVEVEDDDQEDEIVWNPRAPQSPTLTTTPSLLPSSPSHRSPITPIRPTLSPVCMATRLPTHSKGQPSFSTPTTSPPITAGDLLNKMSLPRTSVNSDFSRQLLPRESSAPQPPLLFGSEPPNRPGHSIWSTSLDNQSLNIMGAGNQGSNLYQAQHAFSMSLPQDMSQSSWSSSHLTSSQNSQHMLMGTAGFAPHPHPVVDGAHQKVPSSSISVTQLLAPHSPNTHDPLIYSSALPQPVQRPSAHQVRYGDSAIMSTSGLSYGHAPLHDYHSRYLALHQDPRVRQAFTPPLSQLWGNTG